jgi:hypothetical protein
MVAMAALVRGMAGMLAAGSMAAITAFAGMPTMAAVLRGRCMTLVILHPGTSLFAH